ncbi:MAG: hypothetical protein E7420_00660 [Ruminococcaceae bacterium]|nr:hypothetical protein [Oscillospiraceae bacterium]MBE7016656.1 hypothetical protein [Oscillospiraceae bacterium]
MPFWFAAFLGFCFAYALWFVEITWLTLFKISVTSLTRFISIAIFWIAITAFFLLASDKVLSIGIAVEGSLVVLSVFANKIVEWIKKSKE